MPSLFIVHVNTPCYSQYQSQYQGHCLFRWRWQQAFPTSRTRRSSPIAYWENHSRVIHLILPFACAFTHSRSWFCSLCHAVRSHLPSLLTLAIVDIKETISLPFALDTTISYLLLPILWSWLSISRWVMTSFWTNCDSAVPVLTPAQHAPMAPALPRTSPGLAFPVCFLWR